DALDTLLGMLATSGSDDGDNELLGQLHEGYAIIMATISNISPHDTLSMPVLEDLRSVPTAPSHSQSLSTLGFTRFHAHRLDRLDLLRDAISTILINHIETGRFHTEAIGGEREIERAIARLTQLYDRLRRERIQLLENLNHPQTTSNDAAPLPAMARWGISSA